jgi:phosphatidylglycerophosphatase C
MQQTLALFDFDGTITRKDTFLEFIKYYKGCSSYITGLLALSPAIFLYKIGIIKNYQLKELVFTYFFRNEKYEVFRNYCQEFSLNRIPAIVKPRALSLINDHIKNGDKIIIISASFEELLIDWCRKIPLELIATKIVINNGLVTGRIHGKNCYGDEKLIRLNNHLDISKFTEVYAYGNSKGDLPLMGIANHKFYKYIK